jgi:hypothetical protein
MPSPLEDPGGHFFAKEDATYQRLLPPLGTLDWHNRFKKNWKKENW